MKMNPLGRSGIEVSEFCLGTMTWGSQNDEAEAHAQIDLALDHGVNFFDAAEMYPTTPLAAATSGDTERIIGAWLARTGRRDDVVLATKIVGVGNRTVPGRDGAGISPATLRKALEGSLGRLGVETVDLYQLHWPNRGSYHFRQNWRFDPSLQSRSEPERMAEIVETLGAFIAEGKIRAWGLSNDSAWGAGRMIALAEAAGVPRPVSIQNEYSLLCRHFDLDLAELSHHEDLGLLAYSPLAAGLLTGKYLGGAMPEGSRGSINKGLGGRVVPEVEPAVAAYVQLARENGLDPAQMALAFCRERPFMTSVILGATSLDQLRTDLGAAEVTLAKDIRDGIAAIRRRHPMPI